MKKVLLIGFALISSAPVCGQKLVVRTFENEIEVGVDTLYIDDYVVLGHGEEGKKIRNFQGKITGIFPDRGQVRVFDYGRTTRAVSIVGKKIDVDRIVAVEIPDSVKMKHRQRRAIILGVAPGGVAAGANVTSDFTSRVKTGEQTIKVEIVE